MNFYSMHICIFQTQYGMVLVQTACKGYCQRFVFSCILWVTFMPVSRVFSARTCVCFANNKIFSTINKLLLSLRIIS